MRACLVVVDKELLEHSLPVAGAEDDLGLPVAGAEDDLGRNRLKAANRRRSPGRQAGLPTLRSSTRS